MDRRRGAKEVTARATPVDAAPHAAYCTASMPTRARLALPILLSFFSLCLLPIAASAQSHNGLGRDRPGDFVINRPAGLYAQPSADSRIILELRPRTIVRVVEVLDQWYKLHSTRGHPDGYIRRSYADPYAPAAAQGRRFRVGTFKLIDPVIVRDAPAMSGRKITELRAGTEVRVVDKDPTGLWYKIESETGRRPPGWIPVQAAQRLGDAR
jgi:Bacterial SH3 domain